LKDEGWSLTLWRYGLVSLEFLGIFSVASVCEGIANPADFKKEDDYNPG